MKILYGYSNCTDRKYNEIFKDKSVAVLQPDQKYHGLLITGLAKNGAEVYCYSGLPINRNVTKKLFIHEKDEAEEGVQYHYYKTLNLPFFRQAMILLGARKAICKHKNDQKTVVICDCLNRANASGMVKGAKKKGFSVVMIVTDLPDYQFEEHVAEKYNRLLEKADGYIFLTEQMNERVNKHGKPYIVLEGHTDCSLAEAKLEEKYEIVNGKKVIVYAGSIKKLYGIQNLVEGFLKANIKNTELQIFGDGDYRTELEEVCKIHKNVRYMGIRPNAEVVAIEQRAALLVNPRPTAPDYTKYSFPSKNMEYMISGTPILTTKLPGMPKEYYPHIYTIEEDTSDGVADALKKVFSESFAERMKKGENARRFVLENKSNVMQAKKIIEFLEESF